MKVRINRINSDVKLPEYKHEGDAGMDIFYSGDDIVLTAGDRFLMPTGIKIAIPRGYEVQIRPRSGLAINKGLTVLNTPGTIDSAYRGEVKVIIFNTGRQEVLIKKGERIAQMVLNKYETVEWEECAELDDTGRGEGGFGSTGIK
jgi:dUTP pyrophosphatase